MSEIPQDLYYSRDHEYLKPAEEDDHVYYVASPTTRRASWAT